MRVCALAGELPWLQLSSAHGGECAVCGGLLVCGTWRRKRTSHLATVSWESLSGLVFAVSLSVTATASCFSSLFGARQGLPLSSLLHFLFLPSTFISSCPFFPSILPTTDTLSSFALWILTLAPSPFSLLPIPLTSRGCPADFGSWEPRWHRASGVVASCPGQSCLPPHYPPTHLNSSLFLLHPLTGLATLALLSHWADPLVLPLLTLIS